MNKKIISSVAAAAAIAVLVGCGSSDSTTPNLTYTAQNHNIVGAKVCDATGTNCATAGTTADTAYKYTFSSVPTLPVSAVGGFFDMDASGTFTAGDIDLAGKTYYGFSNKITQSTTLVIARMMAAGADTSSATEINTYVAAAAAEAGVSTTELLKLPSEVTEATTIAYLSKLTDVILSGGDLAATTIDNANTSTYLNYVNANGNDSAALDSDLFGSYMIDETSSDFYVAKYAIPVYTGQDADSVAIYNNINQSGWEALESSEYSDDVYTMYRSDSELDCTANFNGTSCTEADYGYTTLATNIVFAYNANTTSETESTLATELSGKTMIIYDSEGTATFVFNADGTYTESGEDCTSVNPINGECEAYDSWSESGSWSVEADEPNEVELNNEYGDTSILGITSLVEGATVTWAYYPGAASQAEGEVNESGSATISSLE
jgi:hypothetical protein